MQGIRYRVQVRGKREEVLGNSIPPIKEMVQVTRYRVQGKRQRAEDKRQRTEGRGKKKEDKEKRTGGKEQGVREEVPGHSILPIKEMVQGTGRREGKRQEERYRVQGTIYRVQVTR